ncbi:succinate--CoA ligase subunit alpha [Tepiditoga spiralis]|uniref:Succinate--CoA ligase subunit alpha n=1 Tax=Tepiditoga spiralis TaxID=2108365 RepID=A0A7G1G619_9BACT|nr:CoA-binding protein [Tepiditoga spiralis]BBE30534.1 succinate--CoA ligase subunit alpha [Tepiditoga spiralis]
MITGNEKVCVQGITGKSGSFHTKKMKEYGTNIVCGTSKNTNINFVHNVPVVNSVKKAVEIYHADTSIIFVPAKFAREAILDAINNGIKKIIIITEHIPQHDMLEVYKYAKAKNIIIIGPNCPGMILTNISKIGIMPERAFKAGDTAIISRSGTLMYEVSNYISMYSTGVKVAIGLGGDPIIGTSIAEAFDYIIDNNIKKVIIIGEVGGNDEITGIEYALNKQYNGKIKVFFAGRTAPKGKRMGHAGAIIEGFEGSIEYKEEKLFQMGIPVSKSIPELV